MKLTLVTGATGLVGNNVVRRLLEKGEAVRVLVRENCDSRPLADLSVEMVVGDIRDPVAMSRACRGVSHIVHAAACVHIGWTRLTECRATNVEGTRNVCRSALKSGARMVHVSSVDALGVGRVDCPADEETPREGKIPCSYVITKREAEAAVHEAISAGAEATIVNPGFMLGPWDWKPSSGRMLIEVVRRFAIAAPSGGCSACDVRDVVEAILEAREKGVSGRNYILAGHNVTYFDLWATMARRCGGIVPRFRFGPVLRFAAGKVGDLHARLTGVESPVNSAAIAMASQFHFYSSQRAQKELSYRIRPLEESIDDGFRWFQEHGYLRR